MAKEANLKKVFYPLKTYSNLCCNKLKCRSNTKLPKVDKKLKTNKIYDQKTYKTGSERNNTPN